MSLTIGGAQVFSAVYSIFYSLALNQQMLTFLVLGLDNDRSRGNIDIKCTTMAA